MGPLASDGSSEDNGIEYLHLSITEISIKVWREGEKCYNREVTMKTLVLAIFIIYIGLVSLS